MNSNHHHSVIFVRGIKNATHYRIESAAGVTACIDGALATTALLCSDKVAEEIQLNIQDAPEPPFHAGSPSTAPPEVLEAVKANYRELRDTRLATARHVAAHLGVVIAR
jgi:cyclohexyl-isocyanide hydratase